MSEIAAASHRGLIAWSKREEWRGIVRDTIRRKDVEVETIRDQPKKR
jgi:hypothetical protein